MNIITLVPLGGEVSWLHGRYLDLTSGRQPIPTNPAKQLLCAVCCHFSLVSAVPQR